MGIHLHNVATINRCSFLDPKRHTLYKTMVEENRHGQTESPIHENKAEGIFHPKVIKELYQRVHDSLEGDKHCSYKAHEYK